jgi:hypothetical protein
MQFPAAGAIHPQLDKPGIVRVQRACFVLQVGSAKIDAPVFRLNSSATVVILVTFSATVFGRQYVGNPIVCVHTR